MDWNQDHFDRADAGAVTEVVKVGSLPQKTPLPTVRYDPAIQLITPNSNWQWINSGGTFLASSDRTCRYALRVDAVDHFRTGLDSVLNPACHTIGDTLW
jgi:hypothetical protein